MGAPNVPLDRLHLCSRSNNIIVFDVNGRGHNFDKTTVLIISMGLTASILHRCCLQVNSKTLTWHSVTAKG